MVDLLLLREASVLVASAISAYTDWKTGFIYDSVTLPLILLGLVLDLLGKDYAGLLVGAVVFAVGYVIYYSGKLGGGDVKLYTGISLALPQFHGSVFILSVLLYSALAAIVFISAYYTAKYLRRGIDVGQAREGLVKAGAALVLFFAYLYFLSKIRPLSSGLLIVFGVLMVFGSLFLALEKGIRKEFFLKRINLADAEDDEVLATEFMSTAERERVGYTLRGVIGEKEKMELARKGVKEILVYRDLPRLGPFILIGCALAMVLPGFTALVLGS